ncbi:GNAT family N-acetyltransferase [Oscillospiraceae bacterium MB08-C2-2]|nr:GNAT family N-acetyltransferase [Oscillospiraceae bacterium MB08-C2-2]
MKIREAQAHDLKSLLQLYTQLHDNILPNIDLGIEKLWASILQDEKYHVLVGAIDDKLVCSCTILIVPNLTNNQRPYALIENVITHPGYRCQGYATSILDFAKELARKENCYKIMLMTGSKLESTWRFYERAGYNSQDKKAFVQWL